MSRETQPYKRSFSASVGAGLGSLVGGSGKQYYILEHKINSKFHKIGEAQEIIVDNIELGRDAKCQVRFDESFETVSRRHAAIVKEGDNWKLVQLSATNPTLLNGRQVAKDWFLQSGDDIQLSVGGPRLGFIVPTGNKSTVGSIPISVRIKRFQEQALRPYKAAIATLSCLLLILVLGAGTVMHLMHTKITDLGEEIKTEIAKNTEIQGNLETLINENEIIQKQQEESVQVAVKEAKKAAEEAEMRAKEAIKEAEQRATEAALKTAAELIRIANEAAEAVKIAESGAQKPDVDIQSLIEKCKDDIYYLFVEKVYLLIDGKRMENVTMGDGNLYGWSGTGFLLNDGHFVTARHCVQGWRFSEDRTVLMSAALADTKKNIEIVASFKAINRTGKILTFNSKEFKLSEKYDVTKQIGSLKGNNPLYLTWFGFANDNRLWSTDWAYINTSSRGSLTADSNLSNNLQTTMELHVLGFPKGIGVGDTPSVINPVYNKINVSLDGLDNSGCFLHTRGTDKGNSGGPIFARKGDELVVIGIVSRGSKSDQYGYGVPISCIY